LADRAQEQMGRMIKTWQSYRALSNSQKVAILRAYLRFILGVTGKTVDDFSRGDVIAWREVGERQAALTCEDVRPFWEAVVKVRPWGYTDAVLDLLCQPPNLSAVCRMINEMEPPEAPSTLLARLIHRNAHEFR